VSAQKHTMAKPKVTQNGISKNIFFLTIGRGSQLLGAIAPVLGFKIETGTLDLASVQKTYQQLASNFDGKLDTQKLIDGANQGMVAAAGDKYTVFMTAAEAKQFDNELSGNIGGGIGAEIGLRNSTPTILRILPDNPAEKAGLQAGDVILSVNGQPATKWTADKTATEVRGEVGTTVKISVHRGAESKDFTITRASVTNPSVHSDIKNGIGILSIGRFDAETGSLAQKAAQDFKQKKVSKVILDLRNNGGGYITGAQDVAGLWLDGKTVVSERTGGKQVDSLTSGSNPLLAGVPTVVLVNGNSASASEIVAGALKDYGVATLIGERTFGKGTVQKVIDLGNGTRIKVTIARWYTPKGHNITNEGIEPNQKVVLTDSDANAGHDPQLDAAIAYLNK
jgi:carboxyl-terminal processing protease